MQTLAYGSWPSSISSERLTASLVGLSSPSLGDAGCWWLESRPAEGGRSVLVRRDPHGSVREVSPAGFSVRSRAHEYGGGAYAVQGQTAWFCNDADQRVYRVHGDAVPLPVTATNSGDRYADLVVDTIRARLIAVQERHAGNGEAHNRLVAFDVEGRQAGVPTVLAEGDDFYSSPCISRDGRQLAWLSWSHPDMPWDHTRLWTATFDAQGKLSSPRLLAGAGEESVFQPQWSADGSLYFVSDRSDWWNLYTWRDGHVSPVLPMDAEFGLPQWVFGMSTYALLDDGRIACSYSRDGAWRLAWIDPASGALHPIDGPHNDISGLRAYGNELIYVGGSAARNAEVVLLDIDGLESGDREPHIVKSAGSLDLDDAYLSQPEPIEFPTGGGLTAHGLYYPPCNPDCRAPDGELPPLLVRSHGGPTAATSPALNMAIQYWTSRGFALLDVNYGGSTGYGRAYRQRLYGQWGVVDVDDCANGAAYLAALGRVDPRRMAIRQQRRRLHNARRARLPHRVRGRRQPLWHQ